DSKRGKTVVLAFWNTTCDSCKQQMSGLRALADIARGEPWLEILAVAVDESPAEVAAVLRQHTGVENPFPVALDPESSVVQRLFDTTMFPETWVIDPSGMVRMRFDGPRDWGAPIAVELLRNISRGSMCPLQVASTADAPIGDGPVARGPGAAICGEYTR
ncbi:MAG: TlpA family protein disulfide reductase, partial [Polyangiaceae bacterium]|nr:TlpA family protein disulfide reductase [Polyangiaceae bacterium]